MSKKRFEQICADHGITDFEVDKGYCHPHTHAIIPWRGIVYAPHRKWFARTSNAHCNAAIGGDDGQIKIDWKLACKQLLDEINGEGGTLPDCTEPDCEYCND